LESAAFTPHLTGADRELIGRVAGFVSALARDAIAKLFQRVNPKFVTPVAGRTTIVPAKRA
jgi:hypothetical protein